MPEPKRTSEADVIALPPIKVVLGEIPPPDLEKRPDRGHTLPEHKATLDKKLVIKRLIAHLKDK